MLKETEKIRGAIDVTWRLVSDDVPGRGPIERYRRTGHPCGRREREDRAT